MKLGCSPQTLALDVGRSGPGELVLGMNELTILLPKLAIVDVRLGLDELESVKWISSSGAGFHAHLKPTTTEQSPGLLLKPRRLAAWNIELHFSVPVLVDAYRLAKNVFSPMAPLGPGAFGNRLFEPRWVALRADAPSLDVKRSLEAWGVEFPEFANEP